jgi:hypothetical protein
MPTMTRAATAGPRKAKIVFRGTLAVILAVLPGGNPRPV